MKSAPLALLVVLNFVSASFASHDQPETIRLTVYPAAIHAPALQYHLMPEVAEQTEGNAAEAYLLAFSAPPASWGHDMDDVFVVPLDQLRNRFKDHPTTALLKELDLAARRNYCHWALSFREQGSGLLLSYLNPARDAANRLALQARIQIASGDYEAAVHTLQTGFALGRDIGEPPMLVPNLVAAAITDMMLDRVAELAQAKDGPNLYWPLANLPRPMLDRRHATQGERAMVLFNIPPLRDRRPEDLSDEESRAVLDQIVAGQEGRRIEVTAFLIRSYEEARHRLAERGISPQRIEAIPTSTVLLTYLVDQYQREADNLYRWQGLPYWQSEGGLGAAVETVAKSPLRQTNPLFFYLPDLGTANYAMAAIDRKVAVLECVEAIRAYAAAHKGKVPASLNDLSDTPVPMDPLVGKPFGYNVEGNTVTLRAARPTRAYSDWEKIYVITIAR
jgi:hypothetical protein